MKKINKINKLQKTNKLTRNKWVFWNNEIKPSQHDLVEINKSKIIKKKKKKKKKKKRKKQVEIKVANKKNF